MELICDNCGKSYKNTKGNRHKTQKKHFCSNECYNEYRHRNKVSVEATCESCGKPITVTHKDRVENSKHLFCSIECRTKWILSQRKECVCDQCGKKYTRNKNYESGKHNFCCRKCMTEYSRTHNLKEAKKYAYEIDGEVAKIHIPSNGKEYICLVDVKNLNLVIDSKYAWSVNGNSSTPYVCNSKLGLLHRVILNAPDGLDVDHINGNGLDNRECNLRLATRSQNCQNRHTTRALSGVRNVSYDKRWNGSWRVKIKGKYYGSFKTLEEAIEVANANRQKEMPFATDYIKAVRK